MTIQRYSGENVEFHTTGDLVAYEDYAELKEEYERLDKSHSTALAKIDSLAAENATLKEFVGECAIAQGEGNWTSDTEKTVYVPASEWIPPTPATDAILASLRAEGVEMAVEELIALAERSKAESPLAAEHAHTSALFVKLIAAQLRSKSEVQS